MAPHCCCCCCWCFLAAQNAILPKVPTSVPFAVPPRCPLLLLCFLQPDAILPQMPTAAHVVVAPRCPLLLDACASEMRRQGDRLLAQWSQVMVNLQPKTYFLQPHIAIPLGIAVVREAVDQYLLGKEDHYKKGFE